MSETYRRLRELSAALRHFVRLVAQEDVAKLEAELSAVRERVRALEARAEQLELEAGALDAAERAARATSRPASPGRGTP